ncbi:hypothetical protein B0H16DRAFT_1498436 [Mycena metata]|uniref:DUF2423 domain-containing protein n=1 Tax=Mycena metata TaxID=1033252 RepID=A0AAD7KEF8_9AGAR|nr:hypothetical protein B0H16DRAFT_1498436 [Mycena metata]
MAKSTRSKVKRSFRSKKRETGIYAATEAARLNRLHAKLSSVASRADADEMKDDEDLPAEDANQDSALEADSMQVEDAESSKKISTHGPRGSRREEWRTSKGLTARPSATGMNRQGGVAARRKAGRSKRRR